MFQKWMDMDQRATSWWLNPHEENRGQGSRGVKSSYETDLGVTDQQELETITNILSHLCGMKNAFNEVYDKRQNDLVRQCQLIHSKRRQQLSEIMIENGHVKNKDDSTRQRETRFLEESVSRVLMFKEELEVVRSSLCALFSKIQLYSCYLPDNYIECVAGFRKQVIVSVSNKRIGEMDDKEEIHALPETIKKLNNETVTCQFDAPEVPGSYVLCVELAEGKISKTVIVRSYPPKLDVPVGEIVQTNARYCTIRSGKLYVSSRQNPFVNVFDMNHSDKLDTMGGDFKKARGIVATDECIYVTDAQQSLVGKITYDKKHFTEWFGQEELKYPLGIKLSPAKKKLYVTSMEAKEIVIFKESPDSNKWVIDDKLQFKYKPYDLAFDSHGDMHVVFGDKDEDVCEIYVYSASKNPRIQLKTYGRGHIKGAGGIAIDKNDFVFVTEYHEEGRLVMFDKDGNFKADSRHLDYPMGVCVDDDGSLFVASNLSHVIYKF